MWRAQARPRRAAFGIGIVGFCTRYLALQVAGDAQRGIAASELGTARVQPLEPSGILLGLRVRESALQQMHSIMLSHCAQCIGVISFFGVWQHRRRCRRSAHDEVLLH